MMRGVFSKLNSIRKNASSSLSAASLPSQLAASPDVSATTPPMSLAGLVREDSLDSRDPGKKDKYFTSDVLVDGGVVYLRAIRPGDKPVLDEGMHHLSKSSRYLRFFTHKDKLTEAELAFLTEVDFANHVALLATIVDGKTSHPAGVGRYIRTSTDSKVSAAELAFAVIEEYQGLGIATILLKHLIKIAQADGIEQFIASVLPENRAMVRVLHKSGLPMTQIVNSVDVLEITLSLRIPDA